MISVRGTTRLAVLVLVATAATCAWAQSDHPREARRRARSGRRLPQIESQAPASKGQRLAKWLSRQLKLTAEQQKKVEKIVREVVELYRDPQAKAMRAEQLRAELDEAQDAGDPQRAEELRRALQRLDSNRPMSEVLSRIRPILTDEQRERLDQITHRGKTRAPAIVRPGSSPLARMKQLRKRLKLNPDQDEVFDRLLTQLSEQLKRPELSQERILQIVEELQQATEAGDEARVAELREQLSSAREEARQRAIEQFYSQLLPVLTDEQRQIVERHRKRSQQPGRTIDARRLLSIARRVGLDPDQRRALHEIERDTRQALREAGRDRDAREKVAKQVEKKIRELLNDEQTARFDELLERYRSDRRTGGQVKVRGRRNAPARAAAGTHEPTSSPRQGGDDETP